MKPIIFLFLGIFLCNSFKVRGQEEEALSPALISLEVQHSLQEHDRQKKLKEKQLLNTSTEIRYTLIRNNGNPIKRSWR